MEPDFVTVTRTSADHGEISLNVAVAGDPSAPLIVCVHGWPEIWHSWRNQMEHFAARGYRVAAMDVRGYGGSSKPPEIEAYRLTELCGDAAAVIDALSPGEPAIVFGHDWGAPVAWNAARLHADKVRAVAGMSVPYLAVTPGDPMDLWRMVYDGKFFYMKYFQEPGVAEAAFGADTAKAVRQVYYAGSADSPSEMWPHDKPEGHAFLDDIDDPDPAPAWMAPEILQPTIDALEAGGWTGPINRYRAQYLDAQEIPDIGDPVLQQPSCFIAGAEDIVRTFVPGMDLFDGADANLADCRGITIIEGAGHWIQQEAPTPTNAALEAFLATL